MESLLETLETRIHIPTFSSKDELPVTQPTAEGSLRRRRSIGSARRRPTLESLTARFPPGFSSGFRRSGRSAASSVAVMLRRCCGEGFVSWLMLWKPHFTQEQENDDDDVDLEMNAPERAEDPTPPPPPRRRVKKGWLNQWRHGIRVVRVRVGMLFAKSEPAVTPTEEDYWV